MKLKGKNAVVTGGARGIGKAICELFAENGANVLVTDINVAAAEETAKAIADKYGVKAFAQKVDVASYEDNQSMIQSAVAEFGTVDILVCNAGIVNKAQPIEDITQERWNLVIGINLMGPIQATQAVAPVFKKQQSGKIIYMASVAGEVGGVAAEMPYAVTKAGVLCLTKSVAKQLAPYNVTANAIAPGTIRTNMTDILQYDESTLNSIPLKRIGNVTDIAYAALYLASSESDYVTGTTLDVNGGMFMK